MHRTQLIAHLKSLVTEKVQESERQVDSLRQSRDNDSKSTAGDKHEVGRAMAQTELDNLQAQLQRHLNMQAELERVAIERSAEEVGFGSMVTTENGVYFIAVGLGVVVMDAQKIFCVSPAAPVGLAMMGCKVNDAFEVNGRSMTIQAIG